MGDTIAVLLVVTAVVCVGYSGFEDDAALHAIAAPRVAIKPNAATSLAPVRAIRGRKVRAFLGVGGPNRKAQARQRLRQIADAIVPHRTQLRLIRALAWLPEPVKQTLRHAFVAARVTSDRRSLRTYMRLTRVAQDEGSAGRAVGLRLRPLGGRAVLLRPGTSDVDTVWGTFARGNHRPPHELAGRRLGLILDLGANIGLTMADLAVRFPEARLVGIELDAHNVLLARANIAPWRERCEVVHGAVWTVDTEAFYAPLGGHTAGHRIGGTGPASHAGTVGVPAISLETLLDRHAPGGRVDYLKMDVEGAERALLREAADWADRVACMNVEVHHPYRVDECERDLRALGFETRTEPRYWEFVIGVRPGENSPGSRHRDPQGATFPGRWKT